MDNLLYFDFLKKYKNTIYKSHEKLFLKNYNNVLNKFSIYLNRLHNCNLKEKDWEIIIGPWLFLSINIYLFYNFLKKNKINKNKKKILNKGFIVPQDYNGFYNLISDTNFHYNIFSYISKKNKNLIWYKNIKEVRIKSYFKLIVNYIFKLISNKNTIIFNNLKIKKIKIFKILFFNFNKFCPIFTKGLFNYNVEKRKAEVRKIFFSNFYKIKNLDENLIYFLKLTMPSVYLENFKIVKKHSIKIFPTTQNFMSESSYLDDEIFKINSAFKKKENT